MEDTQKTERLNKVGDLIYKNNCLYKIIKIENGLCECKPLNSCSEEDLK